MFGNRAASWNMRDRHMAATLDALIAFLEFDRRAPKIVVWAHNSHIGDASATEMAGRGELNVGQLVRERWGHSALLVGFTTYAGTVTAASDWDMPAERKIVRPALEGSYEALFHDLGLRNFFLGLRGTSEAILGLRQPRLERAIGVIYRPETERMSHYFRARLPHQFDAILHYDVTRAVEPLERTGLWERGELPQACPLQRLDGASHVIVKYGVELVRQSRAKVMAHSLRLRAIDHANRPLQPRLPQAEDGFTGSTKTKEEVSEAEVVEQSFVTPFESRTDDFPLSRHVPI